MGVQRETSFKKFPFGALLALPYKPKFAPQKNHRLLYEAVVFCVEMNYDSTMLLTNITSPTAQPSKKSKRSLWMLPDQ